MKMRIVRWVIVAILAMVIFTTFAQDTRKIIKPQRIVPNASHDLGQARIDSAADYQRFRKEAESNIAGNQKKIATLKEKKLDEKKQSKEKYNEEVLALEQKNEDLRIRITTSGSTMTSQWTYFKREFTSDMDELRRAIKDIGVNDTK